MLKPNLDGKGHEVAAPFRTDALGRRVHGDDATPGALPPGAAEPAATVDATLRVRNYAVPGYTAYEARLLAERDHAHAPVTIVWVGFNGPLPGAALAHARPEPAATTHRLRLLPQPGARAALRLAHASRSGGEASEAADPRRLLP